MPDPLVGFRASDQEELAPGERLLLQLRQDNAGMITLIERSDAMMRWLDTPAGKAWQHEIERMLQEAMEVLLSVPTLRCKEARTAHFNARTAVNSFKAMERIINAGPELTSKMEAETRQANAELSNG